MHIEIEVFFENIKRTHSSNYPFVVFRKPNEELITAYIQKTKKLYELHSFDESGFVFAPFDKNEKRVIFPDSKCKKITSLINTKTKLKNQKKTTSFDQPSTIQSEKSHIELVRKALDFIKEKKAQKIVLSRKETLEIDGLDFINTMKKMLENYKNAFVYLWYHPSVGLWMGATPERFIKSKNDKFETMALAGTRPYEGFDMVQWNEKEKQEQQFVTDFILDTIEDSVEIEEIKGPYSVRAGNLVHLRTDISGHLKSVDSLKNLIEELHPTPAVCGLPKGVASKFILKNEGYNRAYYSGFLGELNILGTTYLFVNLRCMQLVNKLVSIYVGGGITKDSNPKKEWDETILKADIIRKVL